MGDVNMRNSVKFVEDNAGIKRHQKNEYVKIFFSQCSVGLTLYQLNMANFQEFCEMVF